MLVCLELTCCFVLKQVKLMPVLPECGLRCGAVGWGPPRSLDPWSKSGSRAKVTVSG